MNDYQKKIILNQIDRIDRHMQVMKKYRDKNFYGPMGKNDYQNVLKYYRTLTLHLGDMALDWKEACHLADENE